MYKIKDFLKEDWMTLELFWQAVEEIDDRSHWANHKKNIKAMFKKDGTPKAKALSPQTGEDYQIMHSTSVFIRKMLINKLRKDRRKQRINMMKKNIQDVKDGKDVPRRISKDLEIGEPRKGKGRYDKGERIKDEPVVDKKALRNALAAEYNDLVRKGDPATKEMRKQIHDEIKRLESES